MAPSTVTPPPAVLEDLVWHAHFAGDIPFEIAEELIEEHWREVGEEHRGRLESDEALPRN